MLFVVYNTYSGKYSPNRLSHLERAVRNEFDDFSFRQTVLDSSGAVIPDIDPSEVHIGDIIAAAGGDGTLNACLQFIHNNSIQNKILLAVIPYGTGNNMIGSLGLNKSVKMSISIIKARKTEKISYGLINDRKTFFNCSLGFSSYVLKNRKTNSLTGYVYDTARLLPSYKSSQIEFDGIGEVINLFAGFFINTKVYMSKFKFLKKNNFEPKMNFFYIDGGTALSGITDTLKVFTGIKRYNLIEKDRFVFRLPDNCDIELDGDIFKIKESGRMVSLENISTVTLITNGDTK